MNNLKYPEISDKSRALTGILSIESHPDYDTIYLGSIEKGVLLGFIGYTGRMQFEFVPETSIENGFPPRSGYLTCLADVFTYISNDLDLAIEFTIAVQKKLNKSDSWRQNG